MCVGNRKEEQRDQRQIFAERLRHPGHLAPALRRIKRIGEGLVEAVVLRVGPSPTTGAALPAVLNLWDLCCGVGGQRPFALSTDAGEHGWERHARGGIERKRRW